MALRRFNPLVKIGRHLNGADLDALPAARTGLFQNKAGFFMDLNHKVARVSGDPRYPASGQKLYIGVAGYLDQFG